MKVKVKLSNGNVFEKVTDKVSFIIGRSPKCDIAVPDDSLSRNHCQIDFENDTFYVTDLDSSNGVFIDGKRIPAQKKTAFTTFQELLIGQLEASFLEIDEDQIHKPSIKTEAPSKTSSIRMPREKDDYTKKVTAKPKAKKNNLTSIFIISILVVAGAIYYQFFYSQEIIATQELNKTAQVTTLPDANLEFYQIADGMKSCDGEFSGICTSFKLNPENQEGIALNQNEYFIFIRNKSQQVEKDFEKIKDINEALEVQIFEKVLTSELFKKFADKSIKNIHVVFKNSNYQISKTLSLNPQAFPNALSEKTYIQSLLFNSKSSGDLKDFWSKTEIYFRIQQFNP